MAFFPLLVWRVLQLADRVVPMGRVPTPIVDSHASRSLYKIRQRTGLGRGTYFLTRSAAPCRQPAPDKKCERDIRHQRSRPKYWVRILSSQNKCILSTTLSCRQTAWRCCIHMRPCRGCGPCAPQLLERLSQSSAADQRGTEMIMEL